MLKCTKMASLHWATKTFLPGLLSLTIMEKIHGLINRTTAEGFKLFKDNLQWTTKMFIPGLVFLTITEKNTRSLFVFLLKLHLRPTFLIENLGKLYN